MSLSIRNSLPSVLRRIANFGFRTLVTDARPRFLLPHPEIPMPFDLILRGGRVIDPSQKLDARDGCRLRRRQGRHGRKRAQGRSRHRRARRRRVTSSLRASSICTPMSIGAAPRSASTPSSSPQLRRHHRGRHRQRRPGQFRGLPQACDRAVPGSHSRLSACLVSPASTGSRIGSWLAKARRSG